MLMRVRGFEISADAFRTGPAGATGYDHEGKHGDCSVKVCEDTRLSRTDLRVDCALAKHARMAKLTVRVRADACLCSHALLLSHSTGLTAGWWSSKWKGANCTWAADCIAPSSRLEQAMLPSA